VDEPLCERCSRDWRACSDQGRHHGRRLVLEPGKGGRRLGFEPGRTAEGQGHLGRRVGLTSAAALLQLRSSQLEIIWYVHMMLHTQSAAIDSTQLSQNPIEKSAETAELALLMSVGKVFAVTRIVSDSVHFRSIGPTKETGVAEAGEGTDCAESR
jgi:hypothetical protein